MATRTRRKQKFTFPQREVSPPSHRAWVQTQADKVSQFEEDFAKWLSGIKQFEELAARNLYENEEFNDLDLRYHRGGLTAIISEGEYLAIKEIEFARDAVVNHDHLVSYMKLIDHHLASLTKRLHEWHGSPEGQSDVPQSFQQGMRDIAESKVVDMEKALHDAP